MWQIYFSFNFFICVNVPRIVNPAGSRWSGAVARHSSMTESGAASLPNRYSRDSVGAEWSTTVGIALVGAKSHLFVIINE
jgi:hypothetical protein